MEETLRKKLIDIVKRDCNYLGDYIIDDKSLALELLKINGNVYYNLSDELKNDREIVLEAVKSTGRVFAHIPDELKHDEEIILASINCNHYVEGPKEAFRYVPVDVKNYKELAMDIVAENKENIEYVSAECSDYDEIACNALDDVYCRFNFTDYDHASLYDSDVSERLEREYMRLLSMIPSEKQPAIEEQLASKHSDLMEEVKSRVM